MDTIIKVSLIAMVFFLILGSIFIILPQTNVIKGEFKDTSYYGGAGFSFGLALLAGITAFANHWKNKRDLSILKQMK